MKILGAMTDKAAGAATLPVAGIFAEITAGQLQSTCLTRRACVGQPFL